MKKVFHFLLFFFLIYTPTAQSTHFIDIDRFDFSDVGDKKGIRMVIFNLDAQRFEDITYFYSDKESTKTATFLKENLSIDRVSGAVSIKEETIEPRHIIRSIGGIKIQRANSKKKPLETMQDTEGRTIFPPSSIIPTELFEVMNLLNMYNKGPKSTDQGFTVNFVNILNLATPESRSVSEIVKPGTFIYKEAAQQQNNNERGNLGELATRLTMIKFGYHKLPSQNSRNNGFDGVWVDNVNIPNALCLSESKFRNEPKDIEQYMNENLNEDAIYRQLPVLSNIDGGSKTFAAITTLIEYAPHSILKFVHRILPDGRANCLLKSFSIYHYHLCTRFKDLSSASSARDKLQVFKILLEQAEMDFDSLSELLSIINSETSLQVQYVSSKPPAHVDSDTQYNSLKDFKSVTKYKPLREKVRKLIILMTNFDDKMQWQGISQAALAEYLGVTRRPIGNLLKSPEFNITMSVLDSMKKGLTNKFHQICDEHKLNGKFILEEFRK